MRDGHTRRTHREERDGFQVFLAQHQAKIVAIEGTSAGVVVPLERGVVVVGRGPSVDVAFDDPSMSRQHVAVEYAGNGFRVRDLGSTNGLRLNGTAVQVGDLTDGDRFEIGHTVFQLVIEDAEIEPDVYDLSDEA